MSLPLIRIKEAPTQISVPEWVTGSMIGLNLPCVYHMVMPRPAPEAGKRKVYIVPLVLFLEVIYSVNKKVFDWWIENIVLDHNQILAFEAEYVDELDPTPRRDRHGFITRVLEEGKDFN
jgi:hypothetical protein